MAVNGGGFKQIADTQGVEFVYIGVHGAHGVALVHGQGDGLTGFAQHGGHILIRRGDTAADIGDHDDGICQFYADFRLAAHELQHIIFRVGFDATGIHQGEMSAAPFALAIDPVTSHTGGVLHNGGALAGEFIEEHGLAHVGPSYNGNQRFRQMISSFPGKDSIYYVIKIRQKQWLICGFIHSLQFFP